jgi:hypothetical protein
MGAQPSTENSPLSSLDSWLAACRMLHYIHVRVERNKYVLTHLAPRSMMLRYITQSLVCPINVSMVEISVPGADPESDHAPGQSI